MIKYATSLFKKSVFLIGALFMLTACITPADRIILKVNSAKDIPDIKQKYANQIKQLKVGMNKHQVIALFPPMERECFESGICNFTVFDQHYIQLDKRIDDFNLFTSSLISVLALTCILSNEDCDETFVAAFHLAIASQIKNKQITTTKADSDVLTLLQWINIEFVDNKVSQWAINEPLTQFIPKTYENKLPPLEQALGID